MKATKAEVSTLVDQLGALEFNIGKLKSEAEELKHLIAKRAGIGRHEGKMFRATVVSYMSIRLNVEAAREKLKSLGVSSQWFTANSKRKPVVSVTTKPFISDHIAEKAAELIAA